MKSWQNKSLIDIAGEAWRPIKGYEERYHVSNMGRVKSLGSEHDTGFNIIKFPEKIRSIAIDSDGYCFLNFSIKGKSYPQKVHQLVAEAFIPNPNLLPTVNHKDCDKTNNKFNNLEWATQEENHSHAVESGRMKGNGKNLPELNRTRCSKPVDQFDHEGTYIRSYSSVAEAARLNNLNHSGICNNINGRYKHSGGFTWKYSSPL